MKPSEFREKFGYLLEADKHTHSLRPMRAAEPVR
jgi:hypothetical protein